MANYDVFNGDADGICALQQLRLNDPIESKLITGVKRDIQLLDRLQVREGDEVLALDISFDKNRNAVERLLACGARIRYFDHHYAGEIPKDERLQINIDTASNICTSLIVDRYLEGRNRQWAVVGAFGDNLDDSAYGLAASLSLPENKLDILRELGILINYNAYGIALEDLHFAPDQLYSLLHPFENPLDFIKQTDVFKQLQQGYNEDMAKADSVKPDMESDCCAIYVFPSEHWANRVSGVFGNQLASAAPARAHAVIIALDEGGYRISVRAPQTTKSGADELCRQFPTGGGRKGAAGINQLPEELYKDFVEKFQQTFSKKPR